MAGSQDEHHEQVPVALLADDELGWDLLPVLVLDLDVSGLHRMNPVMMTTVPGGRMTGGRGCSFSS